MERWRLLRDWDRPTHLYSSGDRVYLPYLSFGDLRFHKSGGAQRPVEWVELYTGWYMSGTTWIDLSRGATFWLWR